MEFDDEDDFEENGRVNLYTENRRLAHWVVSEFPMQSDDIEEVDINGIKKYFIPGLREERIVPYLKELGKRGRLLNRDYLVKDSQTGVNVIWRTKDGETG